MNKVCEEKVKISHYSMTRHPTANAPTIPAAAVPTNGPKTLVEARTDDAAPSGVMLGSAVFFVAEPLDMPSAYAAALPAPKFVGIAVATVVLASSTIRLATPPADMGVW